MRDTLIQFMDSLRDYVHESNTNISTDERDSSEFVDVFIKNNKELKSASDKIMWWQSQCYEFEQVANAGAKLFDDAKKTIEAQAKEIERLKLHLDILAEHMAEVKAIVDGCEENTLSEIVDNCLHEIKTKLPQPQEVKS